MSKQNLIDRVIKEIEYLMAQGDIESIEELIKSTPTANLIAFLPEEEWHKFRPNNAEKFIDPDDTESYGPEDPNNKYVEAVKVIVKGKRKNKKPSTT